MATVQDKNDLTVGIVWKKLLGFFFPVLLGLLFQQLYNTVDAVIVGKFLGAEALAAVGGSSAVITNLIIGFFTGLNSGATVMIAQKFGAKDDNALSRTLHTAFLMCIAIGLFISAAGWYLVPVLLRMVGNPEDIMVASVSYLRVYFLGAVPLLLYNLGQGTLQAVGDSRRPLIYLIISCCLNILLDIIFVAVLSLGVIGVGLASVISMTVCALLVIGNLIRSQNSWQLRVKSLQLDTSSLKRIIRIGIPAGLECSMYAIANLIIQAAVNSFGTVTVSAWAAVSKFDGIFWVTSNAIGVSICAFVGQCYGAGKLDRMKKAVATGLGFAICTALLISSVLLFLGRPALSLVLDNTAVVDCSMILMWCFIPYYFIWSFIEVLSGTFRGVGDTLRPMLIVMLGSCVFRIIWMYTVVPLHHTITAVSYVYVVSWTLTALAFIVYWFSRRWLPPELRAKFSQR